MSLAWVDNNLIIHDYPPDTEYKFSNFNNSFTVKELERPIDAVKVKSSPNPDGIDYKMIKNLSVILKKELLLLLNFCYEKSELKEWKEVQTIFIDKANKEKVRPITISSCMGKILERMINERLTWWAEKENKFAKSQNSFKKDRLCVDNLTRLSMETETGLLEDKSILYSLTSHLLMTTCVEIA